MKFHEVVKVGAEFCLRRLDTGRPIAWAKTNSPEFQAYCDEAEQDVATYIEED